MITFAEAMLIVHGELLPDWTNGTLHVLSSGLEDKRSYCVFAGAREYVVDHDINYLGLDQPIAFVDKGSGEVRLENEMYVAGRLEAMTKVALTPAEIAQYMNDVERRAE